MSLVDYDVIIVGAGFAGVNLAHNLAKEDKTVLIVEAGPSPSRSREDYIENFWLNTFKSPSAPYPPNDNAGLDIKEAPGRTNAPRATIQDVTITANGTRTKLERNQQTYLTYDEGEGIDYMQSPFASTYERVAGGTGNHWMGTCLRMADVDFRILDEYGVGKNWPEDISARVLAEDYAQAEARIGVSADADEQRRYTNAYFPDGYEYPMPALSRSLVDRRIAASVDGHALTQDNGTAARVTGTPAGRNTRPYAGRRQGLPWQHELHTALSHPGEIRSNRDLELRPRYRKSTRDVHDGSYPDIAWKRIEGEGASLQTIHRHQSTGPLGSYRRGHVGKRGYDLRTGGERH